MRRAHVPATAGLYPPFIVDQLVEAARQRDHRAIDRITDELATAGFCRQREEAGRFGSVSLGRKLDALFGGER